MRWQRRLVATLLPVLALAGCTDDESGQGLPVSRWASEGVMGASEMVLADDGTFTFRSETFASADCVGEWTWDGDRIETECESDGRTVRRTFRLAGDDALINVAGDAVYVPAG